MYNAYIMQMNALDAISWCSENIAKLDYIFEHHGETRYSGGASWAMFVRADGEFNVWTEDSQIDLCLKLKFGVSK